jgi:hypothetical protein
MHLPEVAAASSWSIDQVQMGMKLLKGNWGTNVELTAQRLDYGLQIVGEFSKKLPELRLAGFANTYSLRSDLIDAEGGLPVHAFVRCMRQFFRSRGSTT